MDELSFANVPWLRYAMSSHWRAFCSFLLWGNECYMVLKVVGEQFLKSIKLIDAKIF